VEPSGRWPPRISARRSSPICWYGNPSGFGTGDGWHPVDRFCEDWLDLARQCGRAVDDEQADLPRPDVLDAITRTVSVAIWFGLTTGYLTVTGRYTILRKFLPCYNDGGRVGFRRCRRMTNRCLNSILARMKLSN
jgi:hypothetical protein